MLMSDMAVDGCHAIEQLCVVDDAHNMVGTTMSMMGLLFAVLMVTKLAVFLELLWHVLRFKGQVYLRCWFRLEA